MAGVPSYPVYPPVNRMISLVTEKPVPGSCEYPDTPRSTIEPLTDSKTAWVEYPGVSRRHALITIASGAATIEDLGSKNGTFVGEQRIRGSRSLRDGDTIGVGAAKLTLRVLQPQTSTETEPEGGFSGQPSSRPNLPED